MFHQCPYMYLCNTKSFLWVNFSLLKYYPVSIFQRFSDNNYPHSFICFLIAWGSIESHKKILFNCTPVITNLSFVVILSDNILHLSIGIFKIILTLKNDLKKSIPSHVDHLAIHAYLTIKYLSSSSTKPRNSHKLFYFLIIYELQ